MDSYSLILFTAGAIAGGFINGLAGFGTALFALGFWLQILPPEQAVFICAIMSVITGMPGAWLVRRSVIPRRIARFIIPGLTGIPVGIMLLSFIDTRSLLFMIAALQISYGGFFIMKDLPNITRKTPWIDMSVGLIGGILGGTASLSGVLPTMWCAMRGWAKDEKRSVLQIFNITILGVTAAGLALTSQSARDAGWLVLLSLPVSLVAAHLGMKLFSRLKDNQFRRLLTMMIFVSGTSLLLRSIFIS